VSALSFESLPKRVGAWRLESLPPPPPPGPLLAATPPAHSPPLRLGVTSCGCAILKVLSHKRATRGQATDRNLAVVEDRRSGICHKHHVGGGPEMPLQPFWAKSLTLCFWIALVQRSQSIVVLEFRAHRHLAWIGDIIVPNAQLQRGQCRVVLECRAQGRKPSSSSVKPNFNFHVVKVELWCCTWLCRCMLLAENCCRNLSDPCSATVPSTNG
jgi:hypothetical protein